jgi:predicted ATPase
LLGRSFDYEMLAAVLNEDEAALQSALSELVADGLFVQWGALPTATYEFRHVLVQDAAHQLLLKRTRQEHHARIAEITEQKFAERAQLEPEILAHHWTEAQQATKAIRYWLLAGQRASERSAIREAVSHLQKGLGLVDQISDQNERKRTELEIQLLYAAALMATAGPGSQEVQAAYTRALSLCDELPQSPMHFAAGWGSWRVAMDFQTGRERADKLLRLARDIGDVGLTLQAHHCQWATLFMLGHQEECCRQIEKGLELYDAKAHFSHAGIYGGHDAKVCALGEAGLSLYLRGYPSSALRHGKLALDWARHLDHSGSIAHALDYAVMLSRYLRNPRAILRNAQDLIRYAEQQDLTDHGVKGRFFRGYALTQFGQVEWGLSEMRECVDIEFRIGTQEDFPVYFEMLAEVTARAGHYDESLNTILQVAPVVEQRGIRYWSAELHRRRGEVLLARADTSWTEAEDEFRQALAISREQDAKLLELRALCSLVRLRGRSGVRDSHYNALRALVSEFPEPHETPDLEDARALLSLP